MTTLPQTAPIRVARPTPAGGLSVGGSTLLGGAMSPQGPSGLTPADIMRVIRQNIWLIIVAMVLGVLAGLGVNTYLMRNFPKYKTAGLILVRSGDELPEPGRPPAMLRPDEIALLQETQVKQINEALFMEAIEKPSSKIRETDWFKSFESEPDPTAARKRNIRDSLIAAPVPRSRLIQVEMTTSKPKDAVTILDELLELFISKVSEDQRSTERKQIDLLTKENKLLQTELEQDVQVELKQLEQLLGKSNVEIAAAWNGKRMQLETMLGEETNIRRQIAGIQQQIRSLDEAQREGRTPPEVQQNLTHDNRYMTFKSEIDRMDITINQLVDKVGGPLNNDVVSAKKLRGFYQQKLDEVREELTSDYTEAFRAGLTNQLLSYQANQAVITSAIKELGDSMADLNEKMAKYSELKQKETRIRDKIVAYEADIRRVREFRLASQFSQASWSSHPQPPDFPSFPKMSYTLAIAVMASLALSLGIAFLREVTDTTVRSPRDIAKVGQLTLLGLIPHEQDDPQAAGSRLQLAIMDAPNSHIAEQFRQIRTRLQYAHSLDTTRSMLITSPSPDDGKSMVACNLAASLALNGRRILLVDANFRRPTLQHLFNVPNENGFGDVLLELDRLPAAVHETDVPNLSVLVNGTRPANPTELLESQFFIDFIDRALEEYDHVIFDSGPMLMVSESVAMAPRVDGVITVVRARGNSRGLLSRLRDELRRVKAEHVGVVLNAVRAQGGGYYGRNIKSYYAYGDQPTA